MTHNPSAKAMRADTEWLLRRGWLSEQEPDLQRLIARCAGAVRLQAGAAVFHQGDKPDGLYGIARGWVKFASFTAAGREVIGGVLTAGAWFGEVAAFDRLPRQQSALVSRDARLLHVPIAAFNEITAARPAYLHNFAGILSHNLRALIYYNNEVMPLPPRARLVQLLLLLVQEDLRAGASADVVVDVDQGQLANLATLSRQTVNTLLGELASAGLVDRRYGYIVLKRRLLLGPAAVDDLVGAGNPKSAGQQRLAI
jgi:CRP-like cAMP-binding protein